MRSFVLASAAFCFLGCSTPTANNDSKTGNVLEVDHSKMDHSNMDHGTQQSSPGAADAPLDLQFIDTMTVHHQGAVEMAKLAETRAGDPELKKFATAIISDQEREIAEMTRWRRDWFGDAPKAINMEMGGMKSSFEHADNSKLAGLSGKEFDIEFVRQMIPHHEGAVAMSRSLLDASKSKPAKDEVKKLAEAIIKAQDAEIVQMNKWLDSWKK